MGDTAVEILVRTFVIGVIVAAPVGAMAILAIQRTLVHGWRGGLATGAGIATADAGYAALAAFGVSALSAVMVEYQAPLRIIGGAGLVWLGWRALRARPQSAADEPPSRSTAAMYGSAVGLTLTNPLTIMAFAAVFASAGLVMEPSPGLAALATAGVALGSLAWWLLLTTVVMLIRHAISDRVLLVVNRVAGGLLIALGILAIVGGIWAIG